jgi:hypothetical protein
MACKPYIWKGEALEWFRDNFPVTANNVLVEEAKRRFGIITTVGGIAALGHHLSLLKTEQYRRQIIDERRGMFAPENAPVTLEEMWKLSGDAAIAADLHLPFHSRHMVDRLFWIAAKLNIPNLILAGDTTDQYALYRKQAQQYPGLTVALDVKASVPFFEQAIQVFDSIWVLPGNHDIRFLRDLKYNLGPDDWQRLFAPPSSRIHVSRYPYCEYYTPDGDKWQVQHPDSSSKVKLTAENELSDVWDANIITFHHHHLAWSFARDGRHIVIRGGAMFDAAICPWYLQQRIGYPRPNLGFVVFKNGRHTLYSEDSRITDWSDFPDDKAHD